MEVFAKTDIGKERKINEDCYYISHPNYEIKLFIIADGMGGYNGGEVASTMTVECVQKYIYQHFKEKKGSREELIQLLSDAIEYTNTQVYEKAIHNKELNGMGTTLDVCLIYNSKIYIGHVGDSRVYRIRKEFMRKITKDHSYVQTLIDDGTITKEEALYHPKKNMLTKAIGCDETVQPDIYVKTFLPGDILIMNTDGLTNMVPEDEIYRIIKENPKQAVQKLIDRANENGGLDNTTIIIIN